MDAGKVHHRLDGLEDQNHHHKNTCTVHHRLDGLEV